MYLQGQGHPHALSSLLHFPCTPGVLVTNVNPAQGSGSHDSHGFWGSPKIGWERETWLFLSLQLWTLQERVCPLEGARHPGQELRS